MFRLKIWVSLATAMILGMSALGAVPAWGAPGDYLVRRLNLVGDATVVASAPSTNFGDSRWLRVRAGESMAYLKFRTPPFLRRVSIEAVDLWLTSPTGSRCAEFSTDVFTTATDWEEDTITWANAPGRGTYEGAPHFYPDGRVVVWTIADLWSGKFVSFLLKMRESCTNTERYRSSEHGSGEPYLLVSYLQEHWVP